MDPYLRPAPPDGDPPDPCPPGHVAEPAGLWNDRQMEIVYDPRRHDVCFMRGRAANSVHDGLVASGWEATAADGSSQLWIRDRAEAMRQLLDTARTPAPGRGLSR
jgi:hypothetical protein